MVTEFSSMALSLLKLAAALSGKTLDEATEDHRARSIAPDLGNYRIPCFTMDMLRAMANLTKRPLDELIEEWQQAQRRQAEEVTRIKTEDEQQAELDAEREEMMWKEEDVGVDT